MTYDLIIFDCDGTLVDSEEICNRALVDLVNQYVDEKYTLHHALENWAGKTVSAVLQVTAEERNCQFPDDIAKRYVEACNKKLNAELKAVPDALELVRHCHSNMSVCVGSNGERQNVMDSLKLCGFSPDYFQDDNIFTRIQVPNGKPAPDLFLYAAENMGIDPKRCLVIEDSVTGVGAAVAAGMDVWGFTGVSHAPIESEKALKNAGAMQVFSHLIHISERLVL